MIARLRPAASKLRGVARLTPVPSIAPAPLAGVDTSQIPTSRLGVLALCSELVRGPSFENGSPIGIVQRRFLDGDLTGAIDLLAAFLLGNELDYRRRRYPVDGERFQYHRRALGFSQERLATMIGKRTAHVSHVETGRSGLGIVTLIFALAALRIPAKAIVVRAGDPTE